MRTLYRVLAVVLSITTLAYAQGNSWDRVRYNGGTLQTKVDPKDWNNHLTVTSETIAFKLKDGQAVEIPTRNVTGLSYGQEAHRRVGTMIALGILVAPLALFGLFHKTRLHFIGIEYTTPDNKKAGLLLQGDKNNYRGILMALKSSTGAPLAVAEEDRKYVPTGISATVVRASEKGSADAGTSAGRQEVGSVTVNSVPAGAEITVDGAFVGNAPATLKLPVGKHTVKVTIAGYKDWTRDLSILAGSEVTVNATLEK